MALNLEPAKIKCSICEVEIPWPRFAAHVAIHQQQFDAGKVEEIRIDDTENQLIRSKREWLVREFQEFPADEMYPGKYIRLEPGVKVETIAKRKESRDKFEKPKILRKLRL